MKRGFLVVSFFALMLAMAAVWAGAIAATLAAADERGSAITAIDGPADSNKPHCPGGHGRHLTFAGVHCGAPASATFDRNETVAPERLTQSHRREGVVRVASRNLTPPSPPPRSTHGTR